MNNRKQTNKRGKNPRQYVMQIIPEKILMEYDVIGRSHKKIILGSKVIHLTSNQ